MKKLLWIIRLKVFLFVLTFSMNAAAKVYEIQASDFMFNPNSITTVMVDDTIHWVWLNGTHTTTSTSVPAGAATWDAPLNSSSPSFFYKVTVAGDYAYKCTFHQLMGMVGTFNASIRTGINTDRSTATITIFPNPFHDRLAFRFSSNDAYLTTVDVYDVLGAKLKEYYYEAGGPVSDYTLNLADLNEGVLFLEFRDSYGRSAVRRIIKN